MNVANLQLEGLIMAIASVNKLLVHKGLCPSTRSMPHFERSSLPSQATGGPMNLCRPRPATPSVSLSVFFSSLAPRET